jgi:hypothetical protein
MVSMNSERFLSFALWRANVTVVHHQSWMYCKYGFSHGWLRMQGKWHVWQHQPRLQEGGRWQDQVRGESS